MKLLSELLISLLEKESMEVRFPDIDGIIEKMLKEVCYNALDTIREAINSFADDLACFDKIEKIIQILEHYGILTNRHD